MDPINGANPAAPQPGQPSEHPTVHQPASQPAVGMGQGEPIASPTFAREMFEGQLQENRRLPTSTGTTWTAPGGQSYAERLRGEGLEGSLSPMSPFVRPQGSMVPGAEPGASPLSPMSSNQVFGDRVTLDSPAPVSEQRGWTPLRAQVAAGTYQPANLDSSLASEHQQPQLGVQLPTPPPPRRPSGMMGGVPTTVPHDNNGDLFDPEPTGQMEQPLPTSGDCDPPSLCFPLAC